MTIRVFHACLQFPFPSRHICATKNYSFFHNLYVSGHRFAYLSEHVFFSFFSRYILQFAIKRSPLPFLFLPLLLQQEQLNQPFAMLRVVTSAAAAVLSVQATIAQSVLSFTFKLQQQDFALLLYLCCNGNNCAF